MPRRIPRRSVVALVALAAVSVCVVFVVLRLVSEPPLVYEEEIPVVHKEEIPVLAAEVSTISLPIKVDCGFLEEIINKSFSSPKVRERLRGKLWLKDVRCGICGNTKPGWPPCACWGKALARSFAVSYNLNLHSPKVFFTDDVLTLGGEFGATGSAHTALLTGSFEADFRFSCDRVVSLEEGPKLNFQKDWAEVSLAGSGGKAKVRVDKRAKVDVVRPCKARLGVLRISVPFSDLLLEEIHPLIEFIEEEVDKQVDKQLKTDKLTPEIKKGWVCLNKPIKLADRVWLVFQPEEFGIAQPHGTGTMLETTVTVRGRPEIVLGEEEPEVPEVLPMPPVRLGEATGGLHVVVDAVVPFEEAERLLNKELEGLEKVTKMKVPKARIYSRENRLRLELLFKKPILKWLFKKPFLRSVCLEGVPKYDAEDNELYVEGLDFTVETKNSLVNLASRLLESPLKDYLQRKTRLPIGGQLAEVRKAIGEYDGTKIMNGLVLRLGDMTFKILGVYNTQEAIHFIVQADGSAEVTMEPPAPSPPKALRITGT